VLARDASELGVREAWLVSLTLWQEHIDEIGRALRITLREPITESAYLAREAEVRAEWVPLVEAAEMLAGDQDEWREEDFVEGEDGTREVSDAAWDRVVSEKEREVRALVEAGKLTARGKGRRLAVQLGSFNDLVWHKAGPVPEDYLRYRVLPDEQAEAVEGEREGLRRLQRVLDWRAEDADREPELPVMPTKMIDALRQGIAGLLIKCWVQLLTAEAILDEIAVEFGGTDPLKPALREEVEETKRELLTIQEHLRFLSMEVVLREPLEEELDEMREWVKERAAI
jgi:hypothetical protein